MVLPKSCQIMCTFLAGLTELCFMDRPVGDCFYCCQRQPNDVQYNLYTRSNPTKPQIIVTGDDETLRTSRFNPANPTVIYLLGYSQSIKEHSVTTIRNAFLSANNYNFIAVDWSRLVALPWYIRAVENTRFMGRHLADFVEYLAGAGVPAATLHVVGFSLGAEAAGFAGKALRARGILVGRITGLDPAFPGYSLMDPAGHLTKGDAAFVDVIHTNPGLFGFPLPIGDVDFYPNAGQWEQPGCWPYELIKDKQFQYAYGCSHNRAWRYFVESLYNPRGFPATLCRDWTSVLRVCKFSQWIYGNRCKLYNEGENVFANQQNTSFREEWPVTIFNPLRTRICYFQISLKKTKHVNTSFCLWTQGPKRPHGAIHIMILCKQFIS